ncbi:hypothetical protein ACQ4PT_029952 [Festuca glaucescens]
MKPVRASGGLRLAARGLHATAVNSEEVPHYELQEDPSFWMENNVQVVIRVRPLNNTEKNLCGYNHCLRQESAQSITWTGHPELFFTFDHVACESVNQEALFRVAGLPMVENCMAGYNSCVFYYGQTGSGKTHTMLGEISELGVKPGPERGMIPHIFELLIARIREEEESRKDEKLKYNCKCSFLEIYNEQITDVLDPSSTNLLLREDTNVGAYVENLTIREVTCVGDIMTLLMQEERESADNELQMLQSQIAKLLQEKEKAIECHLKSQETIEDLSSEVLQLKSEIIDKEKCYEARLKLETKMQEKDSDAAASLILWHNEKEALQFEVSEATGLAGQKSLEASILTARFQDTHATIANAESTTVKALMKANENAELQAEKYKQKESSFIIEKDYLLSEIGSLKMLLHEKEQNYQDMEKKFESSLIEANDVANELEDGIRYLKNFLSESLESVSSDVEWMKSKFRQFAELATTWLEDIWLEIIGKDCAVSVLHLCHMGILLDIITGLHAENSFLQHGICESLISTLRVHNGKAKNELEMCSVLKAKLLVDINNNFGLIAKKEQEATELSSKLDSFGKKILHLQAQEEEMLARADSMYNELSVLTEEIDATNMKHNEKISVLEKQLANAASELGAVSLENSELRSQLNRIERRSYFMKEELTRESNATEKMEERLTELRNLLDERSSFLQNLQNDFAKFSDEKQCCDSQVLILRDKLERAQALAEERETIATEAWQVADEMKAYAEEKDEEVKLLERSVDDLESTVCALEEQLASKVGEPNAVSFAKNEQVTELSSRLNSFVKNIMHLHRQEEAMLSGSNSMHSEPSILIDEVVATNRGALAAESKENEDLHHQLDEALFFNGMLKDRMLEDLSLLQVNNAIPVTDMEGCSQFQSCDLLANYHHESVMINTIANDIETIVLASELKQHKAEVQEQMLMCTEVVEGLKTESTLWKVDQEFGSAIIDELLEENSNIRTDLENLKRNKDEIMVRVKRAKAATSPMCSLSK